MVVGLFRQISYVFIERRAEGRDFAHHFDLSRGRSKQAEEAIHRGGFAGPVLPHECEEVAFPHLQAEAVEGSHPPAQKSPPEMHVNIFRDDHMAPTQKRLLSACMMPSSGLSLKSSLDNAFLMSCEVLHVQAWTFLSQPQGQSMRAAMRVPRASSL